MISNLPPYLKKAVIANIIPILVLVVSTITVLYMLVASMTSDDNDSGLGVLVSAILLMPIGILIAIWGGTLMIAMRDKTQRMATISTAIGYIGSAAIIVIGAKLFKDWNAR